MKKLLSIIMVVLIITVLAGCNYAVKTPAYPTAAPYSGINTPDYNIIYGTNNGTNSGYSYGAGGTGAGPNIR